MKTTLSTKLHTPGPWKHNPRFMTTIEAEKPDENTGYLYTVAECHRGLLPDDEQEANARLIRSCPDLLAALEADIRAEDAEREFRLYRDEVSAPKESEYHELYDQEKYERLESAAEWTKKEFRELRNAALSLAKPEGGAA